VLCIMWVSNYSSRPWLPCSLLLIHPPSYDGSRYAVTVTLTVAVSVTVSFSVAVTVTVKIWLGAIGVMMRGPSDVGEGAAGGGDGAGGDWTVGFVEEDA
jgi:hypothetical protein